MFEGLRRRILDFRVGLAFPHVEKLAMAAHLIEAERRFESSHLHVQVGTIKNRAAEAAREKFNEKTKSLERELAELEPQRNLLRRQLVILTRDYRSEIDGLHKNKDTLIAQQQVLGRLMEDLQRERASAQENLSDAYAHLQQVKDEISSWHNESKRSPWLLGNKRQKLPKHAFFGQSFGDLDELKADRDRAAHAIGECRAVNDKIEGRKKGVWEERQKMKSAVAGVFAQIEAVKMTRSQMFELRTKGLQAPKLEDEITQLAVLDSGVRASLSKIERESKKFVEAMELDLGIRDREAEICAIARAKDKFLSEFHSERSRAARRLEHRDQWLGARG